MLIQLLCNEKFHSFCRMKKVWKDEMNEEKNLAAVIKDMKPMDRLNEILSAAVEEMKKSNKFSSAVMLLCSIISVICILNTMC